MKKAVLTAAFTLMCMLPRTIQATTLNEANYGHPGYSPDQEEVSYQVFYDQLSPYGHWYNDPRYGYAWEPETGMGFNPYVTGGHWVYTTYGWTWVSDYNWGWAPFHYGRWAMNDYGGWLWIPGYEWSPAWVTWGNYGGYYGWAPLPYGISNEAYYGGYRPEYRYWTFCDRGHFNDEHMERYGIRNNSVAYNYYNNTTIINNYSNGEGGRRYAGGPRREEVEQYSHTTIRPASIENSKQPGKDMNANGRINMYRPAMSSYASIHAKAAPAKVEPIANMKANSMHTAPAVQQNRSNVPITRPGNNSSVQPQNKPGVIPANRANTPQGATQTGVNRGTPATRPNNNNTVQPQNRAGNMPTNHANTPQGTGQTGVNRGAPAAQRPQQQSHTPYQQQPQNRQTVPQTRPQQNPAMHQLQPQNREAAPQRPPQQQPVHQQPAAPHNESPQAPPREQTRPEGGERPR